MAQASPAFYIAVRPPSQKSLGSACLVGRTAEHRKEKRLLVHCGYCTVTNLPHDVG